jgi:uncharacterized membrane protein YczE
MPTKIQLRLTALPVSDRPFRRFAQLLAGLVLYAVSMALMVRSGLGLAPWSVLTEGLAKRTGLTFGAITAIIGVVVLLLWIPLRQRPGIGTIANVITISLAVDGALAVLPTPTSLPSRIALLLAGIVLNGLATAGYVGARLGPGPRDGLMTGLRGRTGRSIRLVRTGIELVVLAIGWLLGGTVNVGTVLYAAGIGPLTQVFLSTVAVRDPLSSKENLSSIPTT